MGGLPWAVLSFLSQINEYVAIWLAFGVSLFLIGLVYYRSTYDPGYPRWYWLDVAFLLGVLGCGIAQSIVRVPIELLQCIPLTVMTLAIFISMIVKDPFILRLSQPNVTPEVLSSPKFLTFCQIVSAYWFIMLFIANLCMWLSLLFVTSLETADITNYPAYLTLGVAIPIALTMFIAPFGCNKLIKYLTSMGEGGENDARGRRLIPAIIGSKQGKVATARYSSAWSIVKMCRDFQYKSSVQEIIINRKSRFFLWLYYVTRPSYTKQACKL